MDAAMVESAWDFSAIDKRYEHHLSILAEMKDLEKSPTHEALADWTQREHQEMRWDWIRAERDESCLDVSA